jgi:hypothetical protein
MKIEATCGTCERTFLLSQIGPMSDAPGRCPFCGARFARYYSGVLVEAVREAEDAVSRAVAVLGRLQAMETGFEIDIDGLLEDFGGQVRAHDMSPASR